MRNLYEVQADMRGKKVLFLIKDNITSDTHCHYDPVVLLSEQGW